MKPDILGIVLAKSVEENNINERSKASCGWRGEDGKYPSFTSEVLRGCLGQCCTCKISEPHDKGSAQIKR